MKQVEIPGWVMMFLLADQVNRVAMFEEHEKCCPHECGPCGALYYLLCNGQLSNLVRPYAEGIAGPGSWDPWDYDNDVLRVQMLTDKWCTTETCDMLKTVAEENGTTPAEENEKFLREASAGLV